MKFKLFCSIYEEKGKYFAETSFLEIENILLVNDEIDFGETEHEFVLVVNKRGQLTVLCTK